MSDGLEEGNTLGSDTVMPDSDGEGDTLRSYTVSLAILVGTSANGVVALEEDDCKGVDVTVGEGIVVVRLSKVAN